jgi:multidrug efflux pump subunit AcrA (membrane-fusion protein)
VVLIAAPAFVGVDFKGRVARIGGEAVPQTEIRTGARIVRVRVSLEPTPTARQALLKPGMEVHVSGRATLADEAILVPSDALLNDAEGSYVWAVKDGQVRRRRVRPGYPNGPETQIVSGLRAGERVVVGGKEGLRDGLRVETQISAPPK